MTGGMAFVYDEHNNFARLANPESIIWQRLASAHWEGVLRELIEEHARRTDSAWAHSILHDWERVRGHFWQICPKEMVSRLAHPLTDGEQQAEVAAE